MTGWKDRLLAALGLGGRKPEADVSYEPARDRTPGAADTTLGADPNPEFEGLPAGDPDPDSPGSTGTTPAQEPGGP
jgi:hypothetical protein